MLTFEMASEIVSGKKSDETDYDLEIFEQQINEYIECLESDPRKSVWPEGCTWLGRGTFRKRMACYKFDAWTGVLLWKIKQDGEGM